MQWLQRNDLTRLDNDARYTAEKSNLVGLPKGWPASFDFQYSKTYKMVYSIDSMHLNLWSRLLRRILAVLLMFNSGQLPNGFTKFILYHRHLSIADLKNTRYENISQ